MSANEPLTEASVKEFMVKNDGKVRNVDLVTHFRQQLNDPVNKSKVRAEFMEIVHTIATVQSTPAGEKYFVLKRPKEGPAVMRKPPRPTRKDRPTSGPPVFRYAKMEEFASARGVSVGDSGGSSEKENRPAEKDGRLDVPQRKESVENGLLVEGDNISTGSGSRSGTPRLQSKFLHPGAKDPDQLSQLSGGEDQEKLDEEEGDEWTGPVTSLEPLEKEWLLTLARGNRAQIMCLLEQDPNLAGKKDFVLGYTGLHWAAKRGREDIVKLLAKTGIDVNVKTHGGYTALHLACMYGHDDVIKILVDDYDADINIRDYSGRKARQVAKETLTIEAQQKLEQLSSYSELNEHWENEGSGIAGFLKHGVLRLSFRSKKAEKEKQKSKDKRKYSKDEYFGLPKKDPIQRNEEDAKEMQEARGQKKSGVDEVDLVKQASEKSSKEELEERLNKATVKEDEDESQKGNAN